jgi:hypothetical protein
MKAGFDHVHDYPRRMELALRKLRENKKVNLHNRLKFLKFLDYLETQQVSMPRRIRYAQNLTKLASMLEKDFETATREDIEKVTLFHGRLQLAAGSGASQAESRSLARLGTYGHAHGDSLLRPVSG